MRPGDKVVGAVIFVALAMVAMRSPGPPVDDDWFKAVVVDESRPVLLKFGAEWCGPCRHMDGVLDQVAPSVSGEVKIVRVNIDEMPQLAKHYGVRSIPQIFLFKKGQIVAKHGGFQDAKAVKTWLDGKIK